MEQKDRNTFLEQFRNQILPVGTIIIYPAANHPQGYLPCDGRELSRNDYQQLFEIIGYAFGGDGASFRLPDLQGQFVRGWDKDGNVDYGRQIGTIQNDAIQGHGHTVSPEENRTSTAGSHRHILKGDSRKYSTSGDGVVGGVINDRYHDISSDFDSTSEEGSHHHSLPKFVARNVINSNYGSVEVASETRPKNVAMLFCIKVV